MGDDIIGCDNSWGRLTLKGKLFSNLNRFFIKNNYEFIITKSSEMASVIPREHRIATIPNGVDIDKFYDIERTEACNFLNFPLNKKIIFFAGNPGRSEKNYKLAKESVDQLKEYFLLLVPLKDIPFDQVVYYYNAADVTLLTSFHEGSPNVIKEAMACNCPIVSTDVGDVKDVFGDTEGCYITTYDPQDVAEKIKMSLEFGKRTKGRERIIQAGLDSKTIANKIIDIYHQVLESWWFKRRYSHVKSERLLRKK